MEIHLDFETYSDLSVSKVGAYRYAEDPSTEVLIACYALGDGPIQEWLPYYDPLIPKELAYALKDKAARIVAHNAQFEAAIWRSIVARRYGGPELGAHRWRCTAVKAASCGLPRSLDKASKALGLTVNKDKEGTRLIRVFCMPRKVPRKQEWIRTRPEDQEEEFQRFISYCRQDVVVEREIDNRLPDMPVQEQKLYTLDMKINTRGIPLDMPSVENGYRAVGALEAAIGNKVKEITGGISATQRDKMLGFMRENGVEMANMQAQTIRDMMADTSLELPPAIRNLLALRIEASKASTKKLAAMMRCASPSDGRVRGTLLMYGAGTGRWAGRLVQPQNFPRGKLKLKEMERVFDLLNRPEAEHLLEWFYDWPIDVVSQCMRGFILASAGKTLYVVDYSSIEARVLAWLSGDEEMLQAFRTGADPYRLMASKLFKVPYDEVTDEQRRIGKNLVLGCGYGLGAVKFVEYCAKAGVVITEEFSRVAVGAYREERSDTVQYWRDVEQAATNAVKQNRTRANALRVGDRNVGCRFYVEDIWLCIELPSGRCLRYPYPKVELAEKFGKPALQLTYRAEFMGKWVRESTYGGKLVENIVQATARDVMVNGMFEAEAAGYPLVGTVHDELIAERTPDGSVSEFEQAVCRLPAWAVGLPVAAKGFVTNRYRKD